MRIKEKNTERAKTTREPSYELASNHMAAVRLEQLEKINSRNDQIINTPALTNTEVTNTTPSSVNFISGSSANVVPQPDNIYGIPHKTKVFPRSPSGQFTSNEPIKAVA